MLVTNFVDGANLATLIFSEKDQLCEDDRLFIALQVCEALRFCHSIPLVHRDIKPANILVSGTYFCVLILFVHVYDDHYNT